MNFLKLNKNKIILILLITIILYAFIYLIAYLFGARSLPKSELTEDAIYGAYIIISLILLSFSIFLYAGFYLFHISKKILNSDLITKLFDNEAYNMEFVMRESRLDFTRESIYGKINGYPVMIYISIPMDKYSRTTLVFNFFIIKFNKSKTEEMNVRLNFWNKPDIDILDLLNKFTSKLRDTGIPGDSNFRALIK